MRLGLTSVTFRKKTPEEICRLASENGIRYIEWGADVHVTDTETAAKVRALCDKYGIKTVTLGSYYRVGDNDPSLFEKDCISAEILGAEKIRIWLGRLSSDDTDVEKFNSMVGETKTLAAIAEKHGLVIGFEYHKKTLNDTPSSCRRFIEACGKKNITSFWQPFSYENDMETLKLVKPYLSEVHVFSWDINNVRFPLDEKEKEWKAFIKELGETETDYIMEFVKDDSETQFIDDVVAIKKWLAI